MKSKVIVYKLSENTNQEMIKYFTPKKRPTTPPYAVFQADEADTVVTLYESGKVMFQGVSADIDAAIWREREIQLNGKAPLTFHQDKPKAKVKNNTPGYDYIDSLGSDEVGTGDYFGPIVVCAAYVGKKDIPFLKELKIRDSKTIADDQIKVIAPQLIKRIKHALIILNNKDYNDNYSHNFNLNKIKAHLHNKALTILLTKINYKNEPIIIDQFVHARKYYEYLKEIPHPLQNITFITKAESKYYSVACAAIISRYIFLKEMHHLSTNLKLILPKGAKKEVNQVGQKIVAQYGPEKLATVAKLNFKNTKQIIPSPSLNNIEKT